MAEPHDKLTATIDQLQAELDAIGWMIDLLAMSILALCVIVAVVETKHRAGT
jgi:hypothetical protein